MHNTPNDVVLADELERLIQLEENAPTFAQIEVAQINLSSWLVSRKRLILEALRRPTTEASELAGEFTEDMTRSLPGGGEDSSTFSEIEDALDRVEAPMMDGKRWLTMPERIAAFAAEAKEALESADSAINAAFEQAAAEYQRHDKRAEKYDTIVSVGRAAIRQFLAKDGSTAAALRTPIEHRPAQGEAPEDEREAAVRAYARRCMETEASCADKIEALTAGLAEAREVLALAASRLDAVADRSDADGDTPAAIGYREWANDARKFLTKTGGSDEGR